MADISFDDFLNVDIRVGEVLRAEPYPEARKPAIKFGSVLDLKLVKKRVRRKLQNIINLRCWLGGKLLLS